MEEEVPGNGGWAKDGEAEEPVRVAGESAAGRKGTRRSENAKVSEEALLTRSSKAKKSMNACVHTYTKSQTPSTRRRGPGWRIHGSVEDTKLSTNKQHSLSPSAVPAFALARPAPHPLASACVSSGCKKQTLWAAAPGSHVTHSAHTCTGSVAFPAVLKFECGPSLSI